MEVSEACEHLYACLCTVSQSSGPGGLSPLLVMRGVRSKLRVPLLSACSTVVVCFVVGLFFSLVRDGLLQS